MSHLFSFILHIRQKSGHIFSFVKLPSSIFYHSFQVDDRRFTYECKQNYWRIDIILWRLNNFNCHLRNGGQIYTNLNAMNDRRIDDSLIKAQRKTKYLKKQCSQFLQNVQQSLSNHNEYIPTHWRPFKNTHRRWRDTSRRNEYISTFGLMIL